MTRTKTKECGSERISEDINLEDREEGGRLMLCVHLSEKKVDITCSEPCQMVKVSFLSEALNLRDLLLILFCNFHKWHVT
jgi:hypothetical protein